MITSIVGRIHILQKECPGYLAALISSQVLIATHILVQFLLIPIYLKYLGEGRFGFLMVLLGLLNFASIGIGWVSGGLVRIMGERWSSSDFVGFKNVFAVGKYLYTSYALVLALIGLLCWFCLYNQAEHDASYTAAVLLCATYLLFNYESLPEKQSFVGTNKQAFGNYFELLRVILFGSLVIFFLPRYPQMSIVLLALLISVLIQRVFVGAYWHKSVGWFGWGKPRAVLKPIVKRLAGKQGVGYISYGAIVLMLQADVVVVGIIGGSVAAGQFVLLWKIPEAISLVLLRIPSTFLPRVIHLDTQENSSSLRKLYFRGRWWYLLIVMTASVLYMLTGQWLANVWVGSDAPSESWMYLAGGFALFFIAISRWPITFAFALIKLRGLVKVAAIELVSRIALIIILFPHINIAAPLVATILVHSIYATWGYQKSVKYI